MGEYKAMAQHPFLSKVFVHFMNISFQYGFSLDRWKQSVHVLLRKGPIPYIHCLHFILLFEADYNGALKILARKLIARSEKSGANSEQTFVERQGVTTQDVHTNLQVTYEYLRINRDSMIAVQNDMKGCFERIRANICTIATMRMEMTKEAALTHARTFAGMTHRVQAAAGYSNNGIEPHIEIGDTGQESGYSMMANHAQVEVMIQTIAILMTGHTVTDPQQKEELKQSIISWVDDVTNKTDIDPRWSNKQKVEKVTDIVKVWRRILRISGADLVLEKCVVYLIDYCWPDGRAFSNFKYISKVPGSVIIPVKIHGDSEVEIQRNDFSQPEKYIGVHLAPLGQMYKEYRSTEAQKLGVAIWKAHI